MVATAALVVVIVTLHLHASNTQKEEIHKARSNAQLTSSSRPADSVHDLTSGKRPVRTISREDEDLLDLMVRIAETPAEWERIHRVLTQIGKEKAALDNEVETKTNTVTERFINTDITNNNYLQSTTEGNVANESGIPPVKNVSRVEQSTISPLYSYAEGYRGTDYQSDAMMDDSEDNMDTGWPDFDEAIAKKVRKNRNEQKNNVIESDWFDDEWMDNTWNDRITDKKDKILLNNEASNNYKPVSFKPVRVEESIDESKMRSPLYRDPKILEFPLERPRSSERLPDFDEELSSSSNVNKSSRPIFMYHRVTTSPHERKGNSAYIAVSVVKHSESPATTETPSTSLQSPRTDDGHTLRPQDDEHRKLSTNRHKRPRWSKGAHHHHNRGHRHYRTHRRAHTQPQP